MTMISRKHDSDDNHSLALRGNHTLALPGPQRTLGPNIGLPCLAADELSLAGGLLLLLANGLLFGGVCTVERRRVPVLWSDVLDTRYRDVSLADVLDTQDRNVALPKWLLCARAHR